MRFTVDHVLCLGCAACVDLCPDVFKIKFDLSHVIMNPVTEPYQKLALAAESICPASAISHK